LNSAIDKSLRQSAVIALLVAGALFMEQLDGTVIATALPQMAQSFGVAAVDLNIGISAYLLTVAVFIPASGWVTDRFGARTVFACAIVMFTLASVLCAASDVLWQFTVARVLQGIGGAMMVPVGRLIVLRKTAKQHLVRVIAYLTWPALMARWVHHHLQLVALDFPAQCPTRPGRTGACTDPRSELPRQRQRKV